MRVEYKKAIIYILYALSAIPAIYLIAFTSLATWAFWDELWQSSYIARFWPFVFSTRIALSLTAGLIPIGIICRLFYRYNFASNEKYTFVKGALICLPALGYTLFPWTIFLAGFALSKF